MIEPKGGETVRADRDYVVQLTDSHPHRGRRIMQDLNLAAEFCDRLILIRDGRIVAEGMPGDMLSLPAIGETYRVRTALERTRRGSLYVDTELGET